MILIVRFHCICLSCIMAKLCVVFVICRLATACKENEAQQEFSVLVTLGHRGLRRISVMITFEQCMEKCSPM